MFAYVLLRMQALPSIVNCWLPSVVRTQEWVSLAGRLRAEALESDVVMACVAGNQVSSSLGLPALGIAGLRRVVLDGFPLARDRVSELGGLVSCTHLRIELW